MPARSIIIGNTTYYSIRDMVTYLKGVAPRPGYIQELMAVKGCPPFQNYDALLVGTKMGHVGMQFIVVVFVPFAC